MKMRWTLCLQERDLEVEEFRVSFCDIFAIGREKNDDDDELTHIHNSSDEYKFRSHTIEAFYITHTRAEYGWYDLFHVGIVRYVRSFFEKLRGTVRRGTNHRQR